MDTDSQEINSLIQSERLARQNLMYSTARKKAAGQSLTTDEKLKLAVNMDAGHITQERWGATIEVYQEDNHLAATSCKLAELQSVADAIASEGAALDAEKKAFEDEFGPRVAEHRDRMIQATRAVNAAKLAGGKREELQREHAALFDRDPAAEARRRHLCQVAFARPTKPPFEVIEFESIMAGPSGWNLAQFEGFDFIPVAGQSADELADLRARAINLIRGNKRAYYLTDRPEADFACKNATLWGYDRSTFAIEMVTFELLPGQDSADLEKRIEAIRKVLEAERKLRTWEGISRGPEPRQLNYAQAARAD